MELVGSSKSGKGVVRKDEERNRNDYGQIELHFCQWPLNELSSTAKVAATTVRCSLDPGCLDRIGSNRARGEAWRGKGE